MQVRKTCKSLSILFTRETVCVCVCVCVCACVYLRIYLTMLCRAHTTGVSVRHVLTKQIISNFSVIGQVHIAERMSIAVDVDPEFVHHNHFYRLNDGVFGVAEDWETVPDTSWGLRYGPLLEEAILKLAKNLTSS